MTEPVSTLDTLIRSAAARNPEVGRNDDFFELGGDSLRATMIAARAAAMLRVPVRAPALFEAPTVAALAAHVEALASQIGASLTRSDEQTRRTIGARDDRSQE